MITGERRDSKIIEVPGILVIPAWFRPESTPHLALSIPATGTPGWRGAHAPFPDALDERSLCLYFRGMTSSIVSALRSGDIGSVSGVLADDVVFSSPVADYRGRAAVSHLLGLISTVVEDVEPGPEWAGDGDSVYAFTAHVSGEPIQGLLRELGGEAGTLTQVTLFLRPYGVLRAAIARMGRLLADSPLPGRAE